MLQLLDPRVKGLAIQKYLSNTIWIDLVVENSIFFPMTYYVGASILYRDGRVLDLPVTSFSGQHASGMLTDVTPTMLSGGTLVIAVWDNYPSNSTPNLHRLADLRVDGSTLIQTRQESPADVIGDITNNAGTILNNIGGMIPLLLIAYVATRGKK